MLTLQQAPYNAIEKRLILERDLLNESANHDNLPHLVDQFEEQLR